MAATAEKGIPSVEKAASGTGRAWTTVAILSLLYAFGTLDRQMIALLVDPIKRDLGFSDMQIGVLQGLAFALFYVLASLPIGWLVDRVSRRAVIFWGTVSWSICAAASGIAASFPQMFAARAGVGAGEATLQPSAFAIIADLFPPQRLALPMSVFAIGAHVGSGVSLIFGGMIVLWASTLVVSELPMIGSVTGWQLAFLLTGLPGLALAFVAFAIPRSQGWAQGWAQERAQGRAERRHGGDIARTVAQYRAHPRFYLFHNAAFAACIGLLVGLLAWNPAFLGRQHGWDAGKAGLWLGVTQIGTSLVALAVHGWAVDRLFRQGVDDAHLRWFAIMCPLAGLFAGAAYLVPDAWMMLILFGLALFCVAPYPGIAAAALQIATPGDLRGKISATYLIGLNLVGAASGPMIVAGITQYGFADEAKLGPAMSMTSVLLMGIATLSCWLALPPMRQAVAAQRRAAAG